jgi:hypothetical protein
MARFLLTSPGPRPPFYRVAEHLWGADCNFDSDGDSDFPDASDWTELTVVLRDESGRSLHDQRVDVDPVEGETPLILAIVSKSPELARRVAEFLQGEAGGELTAA